VKKKAFLAAFKVSANLSKAAAAVGIERGMHYRWLKEDPWYIEEFERAKEEAAQSLEDEAVRRAHEGVLSPIVYHGRVCYESVPVLGDDGEPLKDEESGDPVTRAVPLMKREYSDTLLLALLKAHLPKKYRDSVAHVGADGGPLAADVTVRFVTPSGS
jgi:hypothetical protein